MNIVAPPAAGHNRAQPAELAADIRPASGRSSKSIRCSKPTSRPSKHPGSPRCSSTPAK